MKKTRITSATLALALAAGGALLIASPASAATTIGGATFYDASDFGVEGTTYPAYPADADWFFGNTGATTTNNFTRDGLVLNADQDGVTQILNHDVTTPATAAEMADLIDSIWVQSPDSNWTLQFPFFADTSTTPPTGFTTLRPNYSGNIVGDEWVSSQPLGTLAANTPYPLSDLLDELYTGATPQFLAYGLWVPAAESSTIVGVAFDEQASLFLPVPTRSISHTTISVDEVTDTGFTLTGTNWYPGSDVYLRIYDENDDSVDFVAEGSTEADALGNVSVTVTFAEGTPAGTYSITFDDDGLFYGVDVFGDPYTTIAVVEMLPATGADSGALLALAGTLLVGGALVIVTVRMRRARIVTS